MAAWRGGAGQRSTIITMVAVQQRDGVQFAPMGLTNMFNGGGAVQSFMCPPTSGADGAFATMQARFPLHCLPWHAVCTSVPGPCLICTPNSFIYILTAERQPEKLRCSHDWHALPMLCMPTRAGALGTQQPQQDACLPQLAPHFGLILFCR